MEPIERVERMERSLDRTQAALRDLERAWEAYLAVRNDLERLDAYLGSREWLADRATDAAGRFPSSLRRGVLSEDAIWNLLQFHKELLRDIGTGLPDGK